MSDVVLKKLEFVNFGSFGNIPTVVEINKKGTTFIVGENLDDGGSSGAGKTTILNAISFALYDKIPSGVSKDRLINQTNSKKVTMSVTLHLEVGTNQYFITRKRGADGGICLIENGVNITPASVSAFNDKIEDIIGISFNLFSQVVNFSGNSRPFLDMSVGDQRTMIEELFKVTILSKKANACKKLSSQTDKDIAIQKQLIKHQESQNEQFRKRLQEAKNRIEDWNSKQASSISSLQSNIEVLCGIDLESEQKIFEWIASVEVDIADITSKCNVISSNIKAENSKSYPHESKLAVAQSDLKKKKSLVIELQNEIKHLEDAKCPYCSQQYNDAPGKIIEKKIALDNLTNEISTLESTISTLSEESVAFKATIADTVSNLKAEAELLESKKKELNTQIQEVIPSLSYKTLKDLNAAITNIEVLKQQLESKKVETNPHIAAYDSLLNEGEQKVEYDKLEELIKLYDHQQFLVKLLMDKNSFIRKDIVSTTIPYLNKRIGYYTQFLLLPHLVMFQPDMSCEISQYGRQLDHGNLSNGEKKRLNLALCLAFRDVLTYLHSKINVLFTDEIDGGSLDQNCIDALINLFKKKSWDDNLSIYVISHRPEFEGRCDRNLIIRKEKGFSTLIDQPDE